MQLQGNQALSCHVEAAEKWNALKNTYVNIVVVKVVCDGPNCVQHWFHLSGPQKQCQLGAQ